MEIIIEFKWHVGDDPFCDLYPIGNDPVQQYSFIRNTMTSVDTAGQSTAYAAAQLGSQFCTCVYSVLIVKSWARLIWWDRTGTIVTLPIHYNDSNELAEFFHHFTKHHLSSMVWTPPSLCQLLTRICLEVNEQAVLLKITVPGHNSQMECVVHGPKASHYTPPGRAMHMVLRHMTSKDAEMCTSRTHGGWTCQVFRERANLMSYCMQQVLEILLCVLLLVT